MVELTFHVATGRSGEDRVIPNNTGYDLADVFQ